MHAATYVSEEKRLASTLGRCVALFESRLPLRQLYNGIGDTFHQASH